MRSWAAPERSTSKRSTFLRSPSPHLMLTNAFRWGGSETPRWSSGQREVVASIDCQAVFDQRRRDAGRSFGIVGETRCARHRHVGDAGVAERGQQPSPRLSVRSLEAGLTPRHRGGADAGVRIRSATTLPGTGEPKGTAPAVRRPRPTAQGAHVHHGLVPVPAPLHAAPARPPSPAAPGDPTTGHCDEP